MSNFVYNLVYDPWTREETPIIGAAYDDEEEDETIGATYVYQEETFMVGETDDYLYNQPDQPTYEEYLELQERMGRVDSGLSEETIMGHLKITRYDATSKKMNEEPEICVICQAEYEKDELVGGLHCRHEYHVECVNKWLKQHNSCPICKADAVSLSTSINLSSSLTNDIFHE